MSHRNLQFIYSVLLLFLCFSCVTSQTTTDDYANNRLLREADEYFENGDYHAALAKYSAYLYSPFDNKNALPYARYKVGVCHYLVGHYGDAIVALKKLVNENPDVAYASEAQEIIHQSQDQLQSQNEHIEKEMERLEEEIASLNEKIEEEPDNGLYHFQLANALWNSGQYHKSVNEYEKAVELDPTLIEEGVLRKRIRIKDDGEFVLRDPIFEFNKVDPVRVKHVRKERYERETWLEEYEALRVSGVVVNEGLHDVKNVSVEITIYDFYDTAQDSRVKHIGRLNAGDERSFSVLMDRYTGLWVDIRKIETKVMYDE